MKNKHFTFKGDEEFFVEIESVCQESKQACQRKYSPPKSSLKEGAFLSTSLSLSNSTSSNTYEHLNCFNYTGLVCSSSTQSFLVNNYFNIYNYYENVRKTAHSTGRIVQLNLIDFDPSRNSILLNGIISSKCLFFVENSLTYW